MKKSFSLILAAALLLTLTACNNSGESSDSSNKSSTPEVVSTVETPESSAAPDSTDTTVSDDPIIVPDDPDNPADPDDPNNGGGVDNSGLELPDNRAGRMVKAGLAVNSWGAMIVMSAEEISAYTGISADDFDESCCIMAMISAVPNEVFCLKPKDGKADDVRAALNNLVQTKQEDPMQYPMVQAAWEQAVVEEDGGYVYLVVHPDAAQEIADTMGATK